MDIAFLSRGESNQWVLNLEAIREVLTGFMDVPIAVVCVYGHKKTGKSFMLNTALRYLQLGRMSNWLDYRVGAGSHGFASRGGDHGFTEGIRIWSQCFPAIDSNGRKYGILLLDTQGCLDAVASADEDVAVFALAATLCSVLILNVRKGLDESQWRVIDEFLQCARSPGSAIQNSSSFQKAVFLLRDWQSPKSYPYGYHTVFRVDHSTSSWNLPDWAEYATFYYPDADRNFLKKFLYDNDDVNAAALDRRRHLVSAFENIEAYLLPHPGDEVAECEEEGTCLEMDPDFADHTGVFIENILDANHLGLKKLWGEPMTGSKLLDWLSFVCGEMSISGFHLRTIGDATCQYFRQCCQIVHQKSLMSCMEPDACGSLEWKHHQVFAEIMETFRAQLSTQVTQEKLVQEVMLLSNIMSRCHYDFRIMVVALQVIEEQLLLKQLNDTVAVENSLEFKCCQLDVLMACSDLCRDQEGEMVFSLLRSLCNNCRKGANHIKDLRHELIRLDALDFWKKVQETMKRSWSKTIAYFSQQAKKVADENREMLKKIEEILLETDIFKTCVRVYVPGYAATLLTDLSEELEKVGQVTPLLCTQIDKANDWFETCVQNFKTNLEPFR